jgi:hypothetical protein
MVICCGARSIECESTQHLSAYRIGNEMIEQSTSPPEPQDTPHHDRRRYVAFGFAEPPVAMCRAKPETLLDIDAVSQAKSAAFERYRVPAAST